MDEQISVNEAKELLRELPSKSRRGGRGVLKVTPPGTTIKQSTAQSTTLPPDQKHPISSDYPPLPIREWELVADLKTGEHYKIVLDGVTIDGKGTWFAAAKYCEILPVGEQKVGLAPEPAPLPLTAKAPRVFDLYQVASGAQPAVGLEELQQNPLIATKIQELLINNYLLAAPADGKWGEKSKQALVNYQTLRDIKESGLGQQTAKSLCQVAPKDILDGFELNGDWASRTLLWMRLHDFHISTALGEINIVYFRGLDRKGVWNRNPDFVFNDRRTVLVFESGIPKFKGSWLATCDPGKTYWDNPMNPKGCACIKAGQYKAWVTGHHHKQRALVQAGSLTVLRGAKRTPDTGSGFGINQHTVGRGQDFGAGDAILSWSAGCLVGASESEHYDEFMPLVYGDAREKKCPGGYVHYTTVIPGDKFVATFPN